MTLITNQIKRLLGKNKLSNKQSNKIKLEMNFNNSYPRVTLSEKYNKRAYNLFFLADMACLNTTTELIRRYFPTFEYDTEVVHNLGYGDDIFKIYFRKEFNGVVIHLIINQKYFIEELLLLPLSPPMPQVSFPTIDPEAYGSLQGDFEFWFDWFWSPYWLSLSSKQRNNLGLPQKWLNFFEQRL